MYHRVIITAVLGAIFALITFFDFAEETELQLSVFFIICGLWADWVIDLKYGNRSIPNTEDK